MEKPKMYNPKKVLWENLETLLIDRYGTVAINKFHIDSKISKGTIGRVKLQAAAIGLDVIEHLAEFFGLEAWQILVPELDPRNPPVSCISKAEKEFYERIKDFRDIVQKTSN